MVVSGVFYLYFPIMIVFCTILLDIVTEKHNKLKNYSLLYGLNPLAYNLSWTITGFGLSALISIELNLLGTFVFDFDFFAELVLKGARQARRPSGEIIPARFAFDVREEQSQVTALDGLRTFRRRHFKLKVLFNPPSERAGEVDGERDQLAASLFGFRYWR